MRQFIFLSGFALVFTLLLGTLFPIGIVGEIAATWLQPQVVQQSNPIQNSVVEHIGPVTLRSTRPIISVGPLPLATNIYTSAIPDWPAVALFSLFTSATIILYWHAFLGVLLLLSIFYMLREHLSTPHRYLVLVLLCSDWMFLFYKKALGATEITLQFSWVLCIVALLNFYRQQDASRQLGWGIGLGILAKITFLLHLFPILFAWWWIRPKRYTLSNILLPIMGCLTAPLLTILLFWNIEFPVRSHDFLALQWERILAVFSNDISPTRESSHNLLYWALDPLPFFEKNYMVPNVEKHWFFKGFGWCSALIFLIWNGREKNIQWMSMLLFSQLFFLGFIAKDLHHLAMATPLFAIWLVSLCQPLKIWKQLLIIAPFLIGNGQILATSPSVLQQVKTPSFSADNQQSLVTLLRENHVQRLLTMDYEIYGVLESLAPEIDITHSWAAISHERGKALPFLLQHSVGGHLLILRSSTGMIYNLRPSKKQLDAQAQILGLQLKEVSSWEDSLWLYQVQEK